jgi:hypothetical protein
MDKTVLVDKDIKEGKEIVKNLDKEGLFFPIAMWYFLQSNNEWRLFFGKDDIDKVGAREYYKKIQKVLNKIESKPAISVNDISLIDLNSEIAKHIRIALKTGKDVSGIKITGNIMNDRRMPDAYIYRVI